jgi:23S rRNA pseudouridine955/2504/2580 synthase
MKEIEVLFEDEQFLVLNKPAGLPVQGGEGVGTSLDALLARAFRDKPLLVHRLDKETSGVLITAKTRESAAACAALFAGEGGIKKRYLALCAGKLPEKGLITEKLTVKGREKDARTAYARRSFFPALKGIPEFPGCSLAELEPVTGRMHQIRRHLAQLGHPVLGDDKYGDFKLNKTLKKTAGLKRLLLHAASVYLPSSLIQGGKEISAPLPEYFVEFLERGDDKKF